MVNPPVRAISERELLENLAWVQALARGLVSDPGRADDVAQDAWLRALEGPPRGSTGRTLRAWLARVVRSKARQDRLAESRRRRREIAAAREEAQPSASDVVSRTALQKRVIEAVLSLDEPERTTVLLHYVDGLSSRVIAERRGETPEAVRKRLSRAQARLRARLEREFGAEGRSWIHALAPLAFGGGVNTAKVVLGGVLVTKTSWAVGVAAAVVALAAVGWFLRGGAHPQSAGEDVAFEEAATLGVEAVATAEEKQDPSLLDEHEEEGAGRVALSEAQPLPGPAYEITDAEEGPLATAELVLGRDGTELIRGVTDEEGRFATELEEEGTAKLLVRAAGWAPQVHEVSLEPIVHQVALRKGEVVSGHVLVNGAAPGERIALHLWSFRELASLEEAGLSWDQLELPRNSGRMVRARANEQGLFCFQGLPLDWQGELRLPVEYRLEDQSLAAAGHSLNAVALDAPREGLIVRVVKRLTLTGRVIDFRKREPNPIPGAIVRPHLEFPRAHQVVYLGQERTDEDGRFTIALPCSSILGGKLNIGPPGREFFREIEVEPAEVNGELDLGDLALGDRSGTEELSLRVVDETQEPIQGAIAAIDSTSPPSPPTDESGRTILGFVLPGVTRFEVYSRGYEATRVAVPAQLPDELEVVLPRGTLLDLRFLQPNGEIASSVTARLAATEYPYRTESIPVHFDGYRKTGCTFYLAYFPPDGNTVVRLNGLREGWVVLNDLKPGLPLELRVEGPYSGVIQEESIALLRPGEHRVHEVELIRPPGKITGRVLDEAGEPLARVSVGIRYSMPDQSVSGLSSGSQSIEEDGSFEIKNVYSSSVYFFARSDGYVTFVEEELVVPEEGVHLEIRLEPGKVITVTVEDESGKRLPATLLGRLASGADVSFGREAEGQKGVYLMRGLPDEEVTIIAYVHSVPYPRQHDPRDPELRIVVPVLGEVQATVHFFDEAQVDDSWLLCLVPKASSGSVTRYAFLHDPVIPGVLPGSYEMVLRRFPSGQMHLDEFVEISARAPIEVGAGRWVKVEVWQE